MAKFIKEIEEFAGRVQVMIDEHFEETYAPLKADLITVKCGRKYAKLISTERFETQPGYKAYRNQQHVYGFVNMHTGDIHMPASWSGPSKHIRGNIFNSDRGMGACGIHRIKYM